jgi:hypothetical protein
MVEGCGGAKLLSSWWPGSKRNRKGPEKDASFRGMFLLPPSRPYFPQFFLVSIVYSNFEFINRLNH